MSGCIVVQEFKWIFYSWGFLPKTLPIIAKEEGTPLPRTIIDWKCLWARGRGGACWTTMTTKEITSTSHGPPGPPPSSYNWLSLDHTASSKFNRAQVIIENVSWNSHEMNSQFIVTKHATKTCLISPKTCDQKWSRHCSISSLSLTRQSQKKKHFFHIITCNTCNQWWIDSPPPYCGHVVWTGTHILTFSLYMWQEKSIFLLLACWITSRNASYHHIDVWTRVFGNKKNWEGSLKFEPVLDGY